jgi:hypothetical protein
VLLKWDFDVQQSGSSTKNIFWSAGCGGTVVDHFPRHPKVKGSKPAAMTLSKTTFSITTEYCNAGVIILYVVMLNVTYKPFTLKVIMLSVVMLNVVMVNVVMLNVVMLNVIMLNVFMLNVLAPLLLLT